MDTEQRGNDGHRKQIQYFPNFRKSTFVTTTQSNINTRISARTVKPNTRRTREVKKWKIFAAQSAEDPLSCS